MEQNWSQVQIQHGQVGTDGQGEEGVNGWKVTKRRHHGEVGGGHGFLLKAAQDDQTSPGDGKSDQILRIGDSHSTAL